MVRPVQRSFSAGEIAPLLHARADIGKYQTGLKTLRNFIVHPEGGVSTRGGFKWVGFGNLNNVDVWLLPFIFSESQAYVLEFSGDQLRFIRNGGFVVRQTFNVLAVDLSGANVTIQTAGPHGFSIDQPIQLSFTNGAGELNNGYFRVANPLSEFFQLREMHNTNLVPSAGISSYINSGAVFDIYSLTHQFPSAQSSIKYTQSADVMTLVGTGRFPYELSRLAENNWTLNVPDFDIQQASPTGLGLAAVGAASGSSDKTYEYVVTAVNTNGHESLASAAQSITQNALSVTFGVRLTWTAPTPETGTTIDHYNIYKSQSVGSGVYGLIGTSNSLQFDDFNLAGLFSETPPIENNPFDVGSNNFPNAVDYHQQRIIYGGANISPQTIIASQTGDFHSFRKSSPTVDTDSFEYTVVSKVIQPIKHIVSLDVLILLTERGVWRITEGDNGVLTPSSIGARRRFSWGSNNTVPVEIGDSLLYVQINGERIRALTYSSENDSLINNDVSIMSSHLTRKKTIIQMAYSETPHSIVWVLLSDGSLLGLTYVREHQVIAWHRHDTQGGVVKSICVIPENARDVLYAAIRRDIQLDDTGSNPGGTRSITTIERMSEREWGTDLNLLETMDVYSKYSGNPTNTLNGLWHLNNMAVTAIVDGNLVTPEVVSGVTTMVVQNGVLTLPNSITGSEILVGFTYECDFQTLDIDSSEDGIHGDNKNVASVTIKFHESRGGKVGSDFTQMEKVKHRSLTDNFDPTSIETYTIRKYVPRDWNKTGSFAFRQDEPYPVTILSVIPEMST